LLTASLYVGLDADGRPLPGLGIRSKLAGERPLDEAAKNHHEARRIEDGIDPLGRPSTTDANAGFRIDSPEPLSPADQPLPHKPGLLECPLLSDALDVSVGLDPVDRRVREEPLGQFRLGRSANSPARAAEGPGS
jgi:hypothetical protein